VIGTYVHIKNTKNDKKRCRTAKLYKLTTGENIKLSEDGLA
jgi:hypothetical protein